jgi:hypothetical protein
VGTKPPYLCAVHFHRTGDVLTYCGGEDNPRRDC